MILFAGGTKQSPNEKETHLPNLHVWVQNVNVAMV